MHTLRPGELVTMRQAYERGVTPSVVHRRVRSGLWQVVLPDVLLARAGPVPPVELRSAALLWGGPESALCAATAATLDGLRGRGDDRVHLAVPWRSGLRSRDFVVVHRTLRPQDVHPTRRPRRTRLPISVVHLAADSPDLDDAVAVLAGAVQQGLVRADHLRDAATSLPKLRFRRQILEVLRDIEGGAHSLPEVAAIRALRAAGLPLPDRQVVRLENGRRRYLDLYWDAFGLCVEIDGAFHVEVDKWWADMLRDAALADGGLRIRHVPAFIVRYHPDAFTELVRRSLRAAG